MQQKKGFTLIEVLVALTILSIGALGIVKYATETQDVTADITHIDTMSRLAAFKMHELEKDGLSSAISSSGKFEEYPGYAWKAKSSLMKEGGWYRMMLEVRRTDTGRTVTLERVFRELL